MKTAFLFFLLAAGTTSVFGQADTSSQYVKQFETIPAISIHIVPDSAAYSNLDIKKNSPFILMFFSPDCEHCQKETKELLAYKEELKNIQILMVSALSYKDIKDFYQAYELSAMPNIKLGQDLNLKLASIYKVRTYPSIFVYDNRGTLAKAFIGNIGVPAILEAVK